MGRCQIPGLSRRELLVPSTLSEIPGRREACVGNEAGEDDGSLGKETLKRSHDTS